MNIIAMRKRIGGTLPLYEYRVFVPFSALSAERQARIHYRCDFARWGEPLARIAEVIAPMTYLRLAPGLAKHDAGRAIAATAKEVEAVLVRALFPEMTAKLVPLLFNGIDGRPDLRLVATVDDLAGRQPELAVVSGAIGPALLGLVDTLRERAA